MGQICFGCGQKITTTEKFMIGFLHFCNEECAKTLYYEITPQTHQKSWKEIKAIMKTSPIAIQL